MSNYIIGDIQGCLTPLKKLLDTVNLTKNDSVYFVGDLINRGPESLGTLRFIKSLPNAKTVLGNHDLHLLAVYFKTRECDPKDTLQEILEAPDADELIAWLRQQPLIIHLPEFKSVIVHAGVHPQWSLHQTLAYAAEISHALQSDDIQPILNEAFGNDPNCWQESLTKTDRIRCLINYFTRMRYCMADGTLDFRFKGKPPHQNPMFQPWFDYPLAIKETVYFGHWANLLGETHRENAIGLDTGCVWGEALTAVRLEDKKKFQVHP